MFKTRQRRKPDKVQDATKALIHAGARPGLIEDFQAIGESRTMDGRQRYANHPTLQQLGDVLIGRNRGAQNKDAVLFELCHLVAALARAQPGPLMRADFFFAPDQKTSAFFRYFWEGSDLSAAAIGIRDQGIEIISGGDSDGFNINFSRMPLLSALYEFLAGMKSFGYFETLSDIMTAFDEPAITAKTLRDAVSRLSSDLRLYRKEFLAYARYDGKFLMILNFLKEKSKNGRLFIRDQDIFDFWHLHCRGKDYKGYKTVFDHFIQFSRAYEEVAAFGSAADAPRLGADFEAGEIDIAEDSAAPGGGHDWASPLNALDHQDLGDIRFFKASSERKPMEKLMALGQDALDLPLAFLRYEIFGQVQSAITTDLQVGRDVQTVRQRLECNDIETYDQRLRLFEDIQDHITELQASLLHALSPAPEQTAMGQSNVIEFEKAMASAGKSFAKMSRKGFSDDLRANEQIKPALRDAAEALSTMRGVLEKFPAAINRRGLPQAALMDQYIQDRTAFRAEFQAIYSQTIDEKSSL